MSRSLGAFLNEDTNQFGPGTDLIVAMLALLLVTTTITSQLYHREKTRARSENFRLATESFAAASFLPMPVDRLKDPGDTRRQVSRLVADYRQQDYPYIFVIGHANQIPTRGREMSTLERQQRNLEYAGRRAVAIAKLLAEKLEPQERARLVVVTTGEFDLRDPARPNSLNNAWVEVVFGKEWKPPSARLAR
jgi:hypothetical protein